MVTPLLPYAGLSPLAGGGLSSPSSGPWLLSLQPKESQRLPALGKAMTLQSYWQLHCSLLGISSLTVPGQRIRLARLTGQ